jgi:hypothetical protein
MSTIPEPPPLPRPKPPVFVWIISIYFIFSAVATGASLALANSGFLPMLPAQRQYFDSLTWFDYAVTVLILVTNAVAAVLFILLRRWAYYLFSAAFIASLISIGYQIATKNWLNAVGIPGLAGAAVGWVFILVVIFYARYLAKTRVLR